MDFWGIVMPGMRFERKQHSAFQFVLAMVLYKGLYHKHSLFGYGGVYYSSIFFPVPYLSWYKSF